MHNICDMEIDISFCFMLSDTILDMQIQLQLSYPSQFFMITTNYLQDPTQSVHQWEALSYHHPRPHHIPQSHYMLTNQLQCMMASQICMLPLK
jgi:hypothetical protein